MTPESRAIGQSSTAAIPSRHETSRLAPIQHTEVSEAVYYRIREMILLGDLAPGKIDLGFLADSLRVSRSTVTNVIQRLRMEGLVQIIPRRGTLVRPFTPADVQDIYEVRQSLELLAARLSLHHVTEQEISGLRLRLDEFVPLFERNERRDFAKFAMKNREFHAYQVSLARNAKLLEIYNHLHIDVLGYRIYHIRETRAATNGFAAQETLRPAQIDHEEHTALVRGFEMRDLAQIEAAITAHIQNSLDNYHQVLDASQGDARDDGV